MLTGISTACLYPMETEQALEKLLRLGFRRFEVFLNCMEELQQPYLRQLKQRAQTYGAVFVSLHPFTSAMESSLLFGDYPRRTKEAFDFYRRYLAACAYLGGHYVVIHGQPAGHGALSDQAYWERFGELYRLGDQEGAWPAQENVRNHRAADPRFLEGMRRALGEECAFVLDVKQCRLSGYPLKETWQAMGDRLVHVHLSDCTQQEPCLLPGQGNFDFAAFRTRLEQGGFSGTAVTEVYRRNFQQESELKDSLFFTKKVLQSPIS